jgi:hypothetical protein
MGHFENGDHGIQKSETLELVRLSPRMEIEFLIGACPFVHDGEEMSSKIPIPAVTPDLFDALAWYLFPNKFACRTVRLRSREMAEHLDEISEVLSRSQVHETFEFLELSHLKKCHPRFLFADSIVMILTSST